MAKAKNNVITNKYSGKVGNIILRMVGGISIISAYPDYSKVKWSKKQKENRKRFGRAVTYSQKVLEDPVKREYYEGKAKERQNAQNMAISDYMMNPEVREIDISGYKGRAGNTIKVSAYDKFKVMSVFVMILNAAGFEVEGGMATEYPYSGSGNWIYKAREENQNREGGKVVVKVTDFSGKVVKEEAILDG